MRYSGQLEADDAQYLMIWGVTLNSDKCFVTAELAYVIDMEHFREGGKIKTVDFQPSALYIERALNQFKALDWSGFKSESSDNSAVSYQYYSNPDRPACTNEQCR